LVFGLADLGREHLLALPGRRLALVGLGDVRRVPLRHAAEELPLLPVEIRLGRAPFVRPGPPLPEEDYREEAERLRRHLDAPGYGGRFRERLQRCGLSAEEAKAYWDALRANLERFAENLAPYLEAAAGLDTELTEPGPR
ncbi:MAG: hypothetical protein HY554_11540, partial [Elusimicrobia bacterium]|nr:hypothetical protein [Elusimicrobiota bacterium]